MDGNFLNIGVAMVDMVANIPNDRFEMAQNFLNIQPGEYAKLESQEQLFKLVNIITGKNIKNLSQFIYHDETFSSQLIAGSTGLGVFSAFPKDLRNECLIHTSMGSNINGGITDLGKLFSEECSNMGIKHSYQIKKGSHPLGITLSSKTQPEKILSMVPGVAPELNALPNNVRPKLIHVDGYELGQNIPIGNLIDLTIKEHKSQISLGLGNPSILTNEIINLINGYVSEGKIDFLLGNFEEYKLVFGLDNKINKLTDLIYSNIGSNIENLLITNGAEGLLAKRNNKWAFAKAVQIKKIINTAGAGDTAAGVFISEILKGEKLKDVLKKAAYFSSLVVSSNHTKLENGRE